MPIAARKILTAAIAGLLPGSAALWALPSAAQSVPEIRVPAPPFKEVRVDTVETSGGRILGLQFGDPRQRTNGAVLTISGVKDTDRTICVRIAHVAGAYSAAFEIPNPRRGATMRFVLPSQLIGQLGARAGELGVIARAGGQSSCGPSDPMLPVAWGRQTPTGAAFALVNDQQAAITRASLAGGRPANCQRLTTLVAPDVAPTAYNMACQLQPPGGTCGSESVVAVQLIDGATQNTLRATLRGVC